MATKAHSIFVTKKSTLWCLKCKKSIQLGEKYVADREDAKGTCFQCSPFVSYELLAPGDAAMTRRSKKYSTLCGVVFGWNQRRKRYERKGQYVETSAIEKARVECASDAEKRKEKNQKASIVRAKDDVEFIDNFAIVIRARYPKAPFKREVEIAQHACEKYSGRVGRTAGAKQFDAEMIDRAVEAHIRHKETDYDQQFNKGKGKREIRMSLKEKIEKILFSWKK